MVPLVWLSETERNASRDYLQKYKGKFETCEKRRRKNVCITWELVETHAQIVSSVTVAFRVSYFYASLAQLLCQYPLMLAQVQTRAHETIYVNIIIIINISSASQTNKWILCDIFVTAHIAHSSGTCKSFSPKNLFASVISWSKSTKPGLDFMRIAHLLAKAYGYWLFIIIVLHSFRQTSMVKDRVMETKMEINKWDSFFHPFKCTDWKEKERKKSGWKTNC